MQSIMMVQAWASKVRAGKGSKGDRLGIVDHPPAFGFLRALQRRNALRRAGAVLLVSHSLCQALGQASFALHICLSN